MDSRLLRTAPNSHPQIFEPVEDEVQVFRRRLGGLVLDHEEALAITSDIPALVIALEKKLRARGGEGRRCRNGYSPDLLVFPVEALPAVGRPESPSPAVRRDLPLPARSRKGHHIDLDLAGLIGLIGHPAAIRRERSALMPERA